jgi:phospholipid/cholesterol/gamma-HCH transport system substrate-binding protein
VQTSVPGVGRIVAMVVFALSCFGLLLFLWLAFGGAIPLKPKGYRVATSFAEATQLAQEADVRISGVPVGKVKTIEPDKSTGRSEVVMEIDSDYAPLKVDTAATLRQKTLLGETYVELTPGSPDAEAVPEEGRLDEGLISPTVELDEIYRAFDERTRNAFQSWMQTQASAIEGRGRDLNDALGNLGPFAEDASVIVDILNRQEGAVKRLISNTGEVFGALTERRGQLRDLITNSNRVFRVTAERDEALKETFVALPTFQRESRATITRLSEFARETDPLVDQLRPAARELSPTLQDLSALAPDLRALFVELNPLIDASRRGFPALAEIITESRPLFAQFDPTLRQLNPILDFVGLYKRELTSFFANTVASTQARSLVPNSNRQVHYLRTSNPFNPENLALYPRRIGSNRPNPYMLPGGFDNLRTKGYLQVYENRHCGRRVPVIGTFTDPILEALVSPETVDDINEIIYPASNGGQPPAPPCELQEKFTVQGETTRFPHVKPAPELP